MTATARKSHRRTAAFGLFLQPLGLGPLRFWLGPDGLCPSCRADLQLASVRQKGSSLRSVDRIAEMQHRLAALDRLLSHYVPPDPADHATDMSVDEAEFWSARFEERELLQAELDSLLERKAG